MEQEIHAKITIETPKGTKEINKRFILTKTSFYQYGNGTMVIVRCGDGFDDYVDTRYEVGITKHFMDWVIDYLRSQYNPHFYPQFELERIK